MDNIISDVASVSEMSTTDVSTSNRIKSKEDAVTELANTKKKLKVLKQALKEEKQKSDKKDYVLKQSQEAMETLQVQMQDKDKKYAQLLQDKTNLEDSIIRDTIAKTQAEKSGKDPKAQGSVTKQIGDDLFRTASKEFSESPSKKESKKEVAVPDAKIIEDIQLKYKTEIDELKSHNDSLRKEIESKNEEVYAFQQEMTSQQEKQMADSIFFDKQIEEFRINTEVKTQELCEKDAIIESN